MKYVEKWRRGDALGSMSSAIGVAVARRMQRRVATLAAGFLLTATFFWAGRLDWVGLAGVGVLLGWAAVWPDAGNDDTRNGSSPLANAGRTALPGSDRQLLLPWTAILGGIPDAALLLDSDGTVLDANQQGNVLLPGSRARHISLSCRAPALLSAIDAAMATGQRQSCQFHIGHIGAPSVRSTSALVTPLAARSPAGEPALLVVLRDVTEQESLAQMRADFVANASHELRTPLASLTGFVETLQGAAKDDPAAREKFLGIMQREASRMARLIDDLLSLSRIEMRERVPPTGRVDIAGVVSDVARALAPAAAQAGITVAPPPTPAPAYVVGDRDELMQVTQNLMQNAIKYGRRGGRVEVSLAERGQLIALAVQDDGIGIAREHLPRLTERFYRISAKDSRERGGTGLGLAIVKHIVNRHQGELRIESTAGQGSTFTVLLPTAPQIP